VRASAHWCVDPAETVQQVLEEDTAWAAPGANADGIQIEQAGYAAFTTAEWNSNAARSMIDDQLVPLLVGICQRWGIPPVALDTAGVASGAAGITTHVCVSEAYQLSDHWDCGPHYPLQDVVAQVAALLDPQPAPPVPTEEDAMRACRMNDGQIVLVSGNTFRVLPGTWDVINAQLIELGRAGLIPTMPDGTPIIVSIGDNAVQALVQVGA